MYEATGREDGVTDFSKLSLASQMKCEECDLYKDIYLDLQHLARNDVLAVDVKFVEMHLNDLEKHIKVKHPERAEAFLKGE